MNLRAPLTIASLLILTACSVQMNAIPTGGSRADGVIELSYSYGSMQKPIIDPQQAYQAALNRCKAWGYKETEAFGGGRTICTMPAGMGGCNQFTTTIVYQCLSD